MTTQSNLTLDDLYTAIKGNSEEIDRAHGRFDEMNKRLDGMDKRLDGMDKRLDGMDKRLDGMDKRLDGMENVLIAIANSLGVKVDYLPESKVISLSDRRQRV